MAVTLNANTSTGFIATSDTSGVLQLQTGGTAAVTVDASQNVGIGTASPDLYAGRSTMSINGSTGGIITLQANGTQKLRLFTGASSSVGTLTGALDISTGDASALTFGTNSAERMRIDTSGNVGIGTSSPSYKLDVAGISKGAIVHRSGSYTNGATTPSVSGATVLYISNSSPTTITDFTNAVDGQIIYLYFTDSNTTINRTNAYLAGGANFVSSNNDMLVLFKTGAYWYEISRSANS